jgi:hypothetical protein
LLITVPTIPAGFFGLSRQNIQNMIAINQMTKLIHHDHAIRIAIKSNA